MYPNVHHSTVYNSQIGRASCRERVERVMDFLSLGSKTIVDGDYIHEIQRHLLLGRKTMTNLDSILKLLVGMQTSTATMENSVEIPLKI